jgi:glycosyltransferase involved in cell wall biosynthesis/nucleotide-binding universal stress UspA family protein
MRGAVGNSEDRPEETAPQSVRLSAGQSNGAPLNVLIFAPSLIPSVTIGVMRPLVVLEKQGLVRLRLRLMRGRLLMGADLNWCDVAVFCRNSEMHDLKTLYRLKRLGKRVIYEIDDNFEQIPLTTGFGLYHRAPERLHVLRRFYELADLVRVYSPIMAEQARRYNDSVHVAQLYFDVGLVERSRHREKGRKVRIAYPTGRIDEPKLEKMFFAALREVLTERADVAELHLWRAKIPAALAGLANVVLHRPQMSYESFIRSFDELGFDIGLAPVIDTAFYHSKTNNKYRELGGCGVAGVYSDVMPYRGTVQNGVTGLLVQNTPEAWSAAIRALIDDAGLRETIGRSAQDDIRKNYAFAKAVDDWSDCLRRAVDHAVVVPEWLPRADRSLIAVLVSAASGSGAAFDQKKRAFRRVIDVLGWRGGSLTVPDPKLSWTRISQSDVTVCVLDSVEDFAKLQVLLPSFTHIIADLSDFREDDAAFSDLLAFDNFPKPVSLLLSAGRPDLQDIARKRGLPFVTADNRQDMETLFSRRSYQAALLEALDSAAVCGDGPARSRLQRNLLQLQRRLSAVADLNVGRCKRAWRLLLWRLGQRPL